MNERDRNIDFYVRITPKGGQWDNPACKFDVGPFREIGAAENAVIAALQGGALTAAIEIKTKPPIESPLPSYHELLRRLCSEFHIPGSPTFDSAIALLKKRFEKCGYDPEIEDPEL